MHPPTELARLAGRYRAHDPFGDRVIIKQQSFGVHEMLFRAAKSAGAGFEWRRRPRCQPARRRRTAPVREAREARPCTVGNGARKCFDGERHRVHRPRRAHLRDSIWALATRRFPRNCQRMNSLPSSTDSSRDLRLQRDLHLHRLLPRFVRDHVARHLRAVDHDRLHAFADAVRVLDLDLVLDAAILAGGGETGP